MKLNHLNLTVTDVPATMEFLETYFGMQNIGGGKGMGFLMDDDGAVLSLMSTKTGNVDEVSYPPAFHIGFIQESEQKVNEINSLLKNDGYDVGEPGKYHGSWTFYFQAPGGFTIEVLA